MQRGCGSVQTSKKHRRAGPKRAEGYALHDGTPPLLPTHSIRALLFLRACRTRACAFVLRVSEVKGRLLTTMSPRNGCFPLGLCLDCLLR